MNWRNLLIISLVAVGGYYVGNAICEHNHQNDVASNTPPVEEQCAANNLTCGCWDLPPGSEWQWVCCDPYGHVASPNECNNTGGTCPPQPSPAPTPQPTPPAACRTTSVDYFENILKPHSGQQVDFTVKACGGDVVRTNHNCGVNCCELSAEKGNQACADELFGMPRWYPTAVGLIQVYEDNTYTQKIVAGPTGTINGFVRVCGHSVRTPGNCVRAQVVAGVPPCEASGTQGCATNLGSNLFNR